MMASYQPALEHGFGQKKKEKFYFILFYSFILIIIILIGFFLTMLASLILIRGNDFDLL